MSLTTTKKAVFDWLDSIFPGHTIINYLQPRTDTDGNAQVAAPSIPYASMQLVPTTKMAHKDVILKVDASGVMTHLAHRQASVFVNFYGPQSDEDIETLREAFNDTYKQQLYDADVSFIAERAVIDSSTFMGVSNEVRSQVSFLVEYNYEYTTSPGYIDAVEYQLTIEPGNHVVDVDVAVPPQSSLLFSGTGVTMSASGNFIGI